MKDVNEVCGHEKGLLEAQTPLELGLNVQDWGQMAYEPALEKQRVLNQQVQQEQATSTLVLVEHAAVVTVSRRKTAASHLIASPEQLNQLGIEVCETDRGGDITYHGPGQLVAYPIVRLAEAGLGLTEYMRFLEQVVIDTLAAFDLKGHRQEGMTGVWVGERNDDSSEPICQSCSADEADPDRGLITRSKASSAASSATSPIGVSKICAMGVRVRRGVAMHGLALNIAPDMSHFQTIVPCGLTLPVTSMQQELEDKCPGFESVKAKLIACFQKRWADLSGN